MKIVKIAVVLVLVYAAIVAAFESLIGYFQPAGETTLVITTTGDDGKANDRVLSRLESDGQLYVAANHWPRSWYYDVLANPRVEVSLDGDPRPYVAVPVSDAEHQRLDTQHALGVVVRILTGFPPRRFVRLDPVPGQSG